MKIVKKYISVGMQLMLLLSPLAIQLMHSLDSDHLESEVCISNDDQHLHEHEVECEICKFQFNSFTSDEFPIITFLPNEKVELLTNLYTSVQSNFNLSFSLRGPPALV